MSNELPGRWGELLGPHGIHSYQDIANKVDISKATAHRLVTGGATSAATVNKVADELFGGDRDLVWRLHGSGRRDHGDWQLPPESSLLTPNQREAILHLIQVMVPNDEKAQTSVSRLAPGLAEDLMQGKKAARKGRRRADPI